MAGLLSLAALPFLAWAIPPIDDGAASRAAPAPFVLSRPLAGLRVEIWQCDTNGRYRHPRDTGGPDEDPNFQGFGHTVTDAEGRYRFRTIRPVPYPGRTPHIHAAVFQEADRPFVTQIYVAGEPLNQRDGLFMRVPEALRPLLLADFVAADDPVAELAAEFDFVLAPVLAGLFEAHKA